MSALNHTLATRGSQDAVRRNRRIQRALTKLYAITKGWLVRFNPYDYMDDAAANTFSYILGKRDGMNWVGLYPSMYHRNSNMMMARWRYRDAELQHQRWSLQCNMMNTTSERGRRLLRRQLRDLRIAHFM